MDPISKSRLVGLHPVLVERLVQLDSQLTANGVDFRIIQALRSWAQQATLYAQGRTTPGQIVTDAPPGYTWHQYGFAIDGCPMVNGQPDWDVSGPNWHKVYSTLKGCELFSGKDYRGRFKDDDHIQLDEIPESPTDEDVQDLKDAGMAVVWTKYFPAS
jgi:peptidoglycan L-alanyl-D-glutamate endopeptidase CwlK